jgi:hypothetical protein
MSNTGTSNQTSASNNISITFAKWFIHKQRSTGIIVDSKDFDFIIAQLDNFTWDEFVAANSDANVDALIPQLVQKMPKKPRPPKNVADDAKPKGKKTRVDAQTSTGDVATTEGAVIVPEVAEPVVLEDIKEVNKRAPKAKKYVETVALEQPVVTVKEVKEPKKRAPKAKKNIETVALEKPEGPVEQPEGPVEQPEGAVKEVKKRVPKAKKIVETVALEQPEVTVEQPEGAVKEVKKRVPKAKKIVETVALEQPEVTVEQPEVTVEQPEVTVEQPEVTVEQPEVTVEQPEVTVKEVKKRAPKAKKIANNSGREASAEQRVRGFSKRSEGEDPSGLRRENVETVALEQTEVPVEQPEGAVKEVKKRAPKAKKIVEVPEHTEDAVVVDKELKKTRGPKKGVEENRAPDEVIVPLQEQSILSEEPYVQEEEEETVLTETFVNDVLFYVDSEDNWFDSNLQPTTKQN